MKILITMFILLGSFYSYAEMEESEPIMRHKNKIQEEDSEYEYIPVAEDLNKVFYNNLLKRLQAQNPKASKDELIRQAEPLWFKHLELEKVKPKNKPPLSNELDIKGKSN